MQRTVPVIFASSMSLSWANAVIQTKQQKLLNIGLGNMVWSWARARAAVEFYLGGAEKEEEEEEEEGKEVDSTDSARACESAGERRRQRDAKAACVALRRASDDTLTLVGSSSARALLGSEFGVWRQAG